MTTTTKTHWTNGKNGQRWVGMPARVFVSDFDGEGYSLYVDGILSGTFGSQTDAMTHAERRYADVIAATPNQGKVNVWERDASFTRGAR